MLTGQQQNSPIHVLQAITGQPIYINILCVAPNCITPLGDKLVEMHLLCAMLLELNPFFHLPTHSAPLSCLLCINTLIPLARGAHGIKINLGMIFVVKTPGINL